MFRGTRIIAFQNAGLLNLWGHVWPNSLNTPIFGCIFDDRLLSCIKLAFHDVDTDTDTDFLVDILARIVARMSACRSACHRTNFRKSRVSDMSARILAGMSVSVSVSWNSSLNETRYPLFAEFYS